MALGLLWWLLYLRRRLVAREAGPFRLAAPDDASIVSSGRAGTLATEAVRGQNGLG
jgi:hypothetical protein